MNWIATTGGNDHISSWTIEAWFDHMVEFGRNYFFIPKEEPQITVDEEGVKVEVEMAGSHLSALNIFLGILGAVGFLHRYIKFTFKIFFSLITNSNI